VIVGLVYPLFEGVAWNQRFGIQAWIKALTGAEFHDFAGSVVVHAVGGWLALPAVLLLGARSNRYRKDGAISAHPPSNIPFLALGAWILTVGWFGFNVMSAQTIDKISGLVAVNSLMAMVGGTLAALALGRNDPGFVHNGPLAGLVAVCAGSDLMHPLGALVVGGIAGAIFVVMFTLTQNRWKIDDVLGVWPLHGLCGLWGGLAAGIFGSKALGGLGGVSFGAQAIGSLLGVAWALAGGFATLRRAEDGHRPAPVAGRGIRGRRPGHPPDRLDAGARSQLVIGCTAVPCDHPPAMALADDLADHRSYLLRFARLQLRNDAWAEDAVSETLLAALTKPQAFAQRSQLKTWLVGILKHKVIDLLRERRREVPCSPTTATRTTRWRPCCSRPTATTPASRPSGATRSRSCRRASSSRCWKRALTNCRRRWAASS
jgi:DNA-directed RNA polymerase specialized sigma24 family protein